MLLLELGFERVRREALEQGLYDEICHVLTLELHVHLSGGYRPATF
jgi:hypothetical protein